MRRGQKTSAEQVVLKLRQIEVQTAHVGVLPQPDHELHFPQ
jgi:hypothetical protein